MEIIGFNEIDNKSGQRVIFISSVVRSETGLNRYVEQDRPLEIPNGIIVEPVEESDEWINSHVICFTGVGEENMIGYVWREGDDLYHSKMGWGEPSDEHVSKVLKKGEGELLGINNTLYVFSEWPSFIIEANS